MYINFVILINNIISYQIVEDEYHCYMILVSNDIKLRNILNILIFITFITLSRIFGQLDKHIMLLLICHTFGLLDLKNLLNYTCNINIFQRVVIINKNIYTNGLDVINENTLISRFCIANLLY